MNSELCRPLAEAAFFLRVAAFFFGGDLLAAFEEEATGSSSSLTTTTSFLVEERAFLEAGSLVDLPLALLEVDFDDVDDVAPVPLALRLGACSHLRVNHDRL